MTLFHRLRFFLALFLLCAGIAPCVSAFSVSSTNVNPLGYQAPGTPMTVNASIDFFPKGNVTFPLANELHMSTDLVDPSWAPVVVLDGRETHLPQETGESVVVPALYLSYPSEQNVRLLVTVTGNIPANPTSDQDLLKVQEMDSGKNIVSTPHLAMPEVPVMPPSTPAIPATLSTPTKKPTIKKTFTPIPTETPTQESPVGISSGIIAITGAVLLVVKRK